MEKVLPLEWERLYNHCISSLMELLDKISYIKLLRKPNLIPANISDNWRIHAAVA
jgi:hypothetical protein